MRGNSSGGETEKKEWVWVPEFITIDDETVSFYDMQLVGGIELAQECLGLGIVLIIDIGGAVHAAVHKDFLAQDGNRVYEYDTKSQTSTELFTWLDRDINGNTVEKFWGLE